jgi:hypothetical protein
MAGTHRPCGCSVSALGQAGTCKRSRETGMLRFEPESQYLKNISCVLPGAHD